MIKAVIEIDTVPPGQQGGNEFGVGVRFGCTVNPHAVPVGEGATLIGIGMAINDYMRSRGCPGFDCLKGLRQ